jgi:putative ABC transport system substrate-binding protein
MDPTRLPQVPYGPRFGDDVRQEPSIKRRTFMALVSGGLLAAPLVAEGQKPEKMARLGILGAGPAQNPEQMAESEARRAFLQAMRELGWVEGENMVVEWRRGESPDQLRAAAADLVRVKVNIFSVGSASLAKIVQLETKTIPIVVSAAGGDLVAAGLVSSLARPGGNITGSQVLSDDLISKRLELLKALVPNLSRVAFLQEDVTLSALPQMSARYDQQAAIAARTLGIELHTFIVHRAGEFAAAFLGMMKNRDQGLLVMSSPFMFTHRKEIIDLAAKHRIVTMHEFKHFVELGGLMSYGANLPEMFRRGAVYVDKILRGAKPADLPVERPTKYEFIINLKTAKALGLTIPPSLLGRADEVIQ